MAFVGGGGAAAGGFRGSIAGAAMVFVRHFSRKCHTNLKRINPKVPKEEAKEIANGLSQILKDRGPLTVSGAWNHAKEVGISGLNSKTHLKIMLKWMRGRNMLRLFCTHDGKHKKFLHSVLPEETQVARSVNVPTSSLETSAASVH